VLDTGCANGFSTFRQHEINRAARYTGVDYANSMIEHPQRSLLEKRLPPDEIRFKVASILALPFSDAAFDVAYTTRVLINFPTWEDQQRAILESLRVVRPSGTLVISEGFWEPLCLLNSLRLLFRLEPLVEHDFNRYLKKAKLEAWLRELNMAFEVEEFSSFIISEVASCVSSFRRRSGLGAIIRTQLTSFSTRLSSNTPEAGRACNKRM
jgi:ubiquinone/menaquinone biosynthesis C-methylase UbiE